MKKLISFFLALIVCLSLFSFVGCNDDNGGNGGDKEINNEGKRFTQMTFEEYDDEYLVKDAKSEYAIVIKRDAGADLLAAVRELSFFFKEATSITLPVKYDDQVSYTENSKFISLGKNALTTQANIVIDGKVESEGYFVSTVGKSIFIIGGSDIGTVYGVYDFLNCEFNYEFYFTDTYTLDTGVINQKLKKYPAVIENPDIDTFQQNYGFAIESSTNNYRYRMSERADTVVEVGGTLTIHNILYILPPAEYSDHPSWFVANNLCFTAHGLDGEEIERDEEAEMAYNASFIVNGEGVKYEAGSFIVETLGEDTLYFVKGAEIEVKSITEDKVVDTDDNEYSLSEVYIEGDKVFLKGEQIIRDADKEQAEKDVTVIDVKGRRYAVNEYEIRDEKVYEKDEYSEMIKQTTEKCKLGLQKSSALNICIGQPDLVAFCGCEYCMEYAKENGGANSSVMIRFCNDLADNLYDWFDGEGSAYSRDLTIFFLAYQTTLQSPTVYNDETKEYELASELKCNENVGVYFAADNYNYTAGLTDETNKSFHASMLSWKAVAKKFQFWFYDTNFSNYLVPYDTFQSKIELYKFANDLGAVSVFDQGQRDQLGSAPGWSVLKVYLESKLRWNVNVDINQLTENFFDACYGEASDIMLQNYLEFRTQYQKIIAKKANGEITDNIEHCQGNILSRNLWERTTLENWVTKYNQAIEAVDYLKLEDMAKYERVIKMISSERVSTLYTLLAIYADDYPHDELEKYKEMYKQDIINTGIMYSAETVSLDEFHTKLGITIF